MKDRTHSTRFLLSWILLGLLIGALFIFFGNDSADPDVTNTTPKSLPDSYADAVSHVSPSVVSIQAYHRVKSDKPLIPGVPQQSQQPEFKIRPNKGSGVIIDPAGHIVTNHHVVANAYKIEVTLYNGEKLTATIIGLDPDTDLAVLSANIQQVPEISLANSDNIRVGDIVLAIGNPFGIGQTVTQGIISATGRDRVGLNTYENFIQTDAAINPGNSGGALINTQGQVLGINSAIYSQSGNYLGISFAIPINQVLDVVSQIIENGSVIRGWLGVEGVDLNPQMLQRIGLPDIQGVLITDVFDNGPGEESGIRVGDILTHIGNQPIRDVRDVLNIIADGRPGDNVKIGGIRERQSFMTSVTLGQRPRT